MRSEEDQHSSIMKGELTTKKKDKDDNFRCATQLLVYMSNKMYLLLAAIIVALSSRSIVYEYCLPDLAQNLVEYDDSNDFLKAITHNLERMKIYPDKIRDVKIALSAHSMQEIDQMGSEILYKLQSDHGLRGDFNAGAIGMSELIRAEISTDHNGKNGMVQRTVDRNETESFLTAIAQNLQRLDTSSDKVEAVRMALSTYSIKEIDQLGSAVLYNLQFDPDLREKFNLGKVEVSDLMKGGIMVDSKRHNETDERTLVNVLMTTYFVHQKDPLGRRKMKMNKTYVTQFLSRISSFIDTVHPVLFIDWDVPSDLEGLPVELINVNMQGVNFSINDYRYFLYRDYLAKHSKYELVLTVDFKDVKYGRNPFEVMRSFPEKKIFAGSELDGHEQALFMHNRHVQCFGGVRRGPKLMRKVVIILRKPETRKQYFLANAGIFGGHREYVMKVLDEMIDVFLNDVLEKK